MKRTSILALATLSLFGLPLFADGEEEANEPVATVESTTSERMNLSASYSDDEEEADSRLALSDDEEEADSRLALSDDEEEAYIS